MLPASFDDDDPLAGQFRQFVARSSFPCVGAKAALAKGRLRFVVARDITSAWDDLRIYPALFDLARAYRSRPQLFQSFVVLFRGPRNLSEVEYERFLWERLQSLTDKDIWHGQAHDDRASADPASPHFSLSFGGEAFFAVGLHPRSSRAARRFCRPAIVFNLHQQFEQLRRQDRYERMRGRILEREMALSGSINPMLQKFGEASEARQYSGRAVGGDWDCPFRRPGTK